jgi:hypothetical protein
MKTFNTILDILIIGLAAIEIVWILVLIIKKKW